MQANAREREPVGAPVIIERTGEEATIYRTNDLNPASPEISMELIYTLPRPVYFLNEVNAEYSQMREYFAKSGRYAKTFRIKSGQVLRLIDMSQLATRAWVASMMTEREIRSLNVSFPLGNGIVRRVSGGNEEQDDLIVMTAICDILAHHPVANGYYSAPQPGGFHAEIGLCPSAFNKFKYMHTFVGKVSGPPRVAGHKRPSTRKSYVRAINNLATAPAENNSGAGLASPPRRMRLKLNSGSLFGSNNNSPIGKLAFGGRRRRTRRSRS